MRLRGVITFVAMLFVVSSGSAKTFAADDSILVDYQVPEWYKDAKLGYWAIWGLYSIPAFAGDHAAEWYGRWIYCKDDGSGEAKAEGYDRRGLKSAAYHREKFGDVAEFGYRDFAPMFTAERFNADEWLDFCVDGGARFFTMMGIFHDNYAMWDSQTNPWNSVQTGPHRDFVAELKEATKRRGLHFGLSNHSAWNGTFFGYKAANNIDMGNPDDLWVYGSGKVDEAAVDRWWLQTTEMADKYQPDLYYFDWCWNGKLFDQKRRDFLEYYYNGALRWNKATYPSPEVVVNYKGRSKLPDGSAVLDLERGGMEDIEREVWQNDTSIGITSWSYVPGERYRSANQIIDMLMDVISKNGVLMLAFGPKADGSIPSYARESIGEVGEWLKVNGEAVYATRPWSIYGEGVTVPGDGMGGDEVEYVAEDIRFTRSKDSRTLYVTFLGYPGKKAVVKTLCREAISVVNLNKIELLGSDREVEWYQDNGGLHIKMPRGCSKDEFAYAFKLSFSGEISELY